MWKLEKLFWLRTWKIRRWSNTNWKSQHKRQSQRYQSIRSFFQRNPWNLFRGQFSEENMSDYHLRSSPLWYNSLIRVENRPVFYKDWFLKGITKVEHLMDDSGKFISLTGTSFQTIHNLTVHPLTFLGIISSIKLLLRYIPHNTRISIKHGRFLTKFLKSKKPSRIVYKKLVSEKSESPNQSKQKWQEDIILMTKQALNWKEAYQMAFQCTKSTKLKTTFNFKFLHRRISTNNLLKKNWTRR